MISGHTHKTNIKVKENKLYINPGSISGAFSPLIEDSVPSFILMVLQGDEAIIYLYTLSDKTKKFEVNKFEYTKGAEEYKHEENNEEEDDDEGKKEEVQEEKNEQEEVKPSEENEQPSS